MPDIPPILKSVFDDARCKAFPKGQIILYQGDNPQEVLLLKSGIIKVYDIDEQGNEKVLHVLKTPAIIPFAFFSGNEAGIEHAIHWFYAALTDCEMYVVPLEELTEQMQGSSALAVHLMHWFSQEVHELLVRLSSLGKTNTRDKLIAALKFLAVHHSTQRRSGWSRVTFPVNQQLLADMTGMTRESAATTMKGLQDEKLIRHPRLTILEINLDRLVETSTAPATP